jgi:PAS domain S-box-containing protein
VTTTSDALRPFAYALGPTSAAEKRNALVVVVGIVVVIMATFPLRRYPVGAVVALFPLYGGLACGASLGAAVLLAWRSHLAQDRRIAWLAGAFAFACPLVALNVVTLPGMLSAGSFNPQVAPYLRMIFSLALAVGYLGFATGARAPGRPGLVIWGTLAAAIGTGALIVLEAGNLPTIVTGLALPGTGHVFAPFAIWQGFAALLATLAIVPIARRWSTISSLEAWTLVAAGLLIASIVATLFGGARYTLDWYLGRLLEALSFVAIVGGQLAEFGRLFRHAGQLERYATFAEHSPEIVHLADPTGRCTFVNGRWSEATGQSYDDALRLGWQHVIHPDDLERETEMWRSTRSAGQPYETQVRFRAASGGYRWYLVRRVPIHEERTLAGWFTSATDVDEQQRAFERERTLAEELQTAIFLPRLPKIEGVALDGTYQAASLHARVGGDWYDVIALDDGRVAFSVGDVVGHGLEAASRMLRLREVLRAAARQPHATPDQVIAAGNRDLHQPGSAALAGAIFAIFDPLRGRLQITNAGMPAPILIRDGRTADVGSFGLLLGAAAAERWTCDEIQLGPNDRIAFYTDGLTEQHRDVMSSAARLHALLAEDRDAKSILETLVGPEALDDVALLIASVAPVGEVGWTFASDRADSAQLARASLAAYLSSRNVDAALTESAELVFGELVGNVVRHAPGPISVELRWEAGDPVLIVRDRGPGFTFDPRLPRDVYAESGRGMFLVAAYSESTIVRSRAGGGSEIVVSLATSAERVAAGV